MHVYHIMRVDHRLLHVVFQPDPRPGPWLLATDLPFLRG